MIDLSNVSKHTNGSSTKQRNHFHGLGAGLFSQVAQRLGLDEGNLRDRLESALKGETDEAKAFAPQERTWLQNTLRFGGLRVEDVMVPRADIVAIDQSAPLADLMRLFKEAGHSRIPVYCDTLDDPRGMVHIKELMSWIVSQAEVQGREDSGKLAVNDNGSTTANEPKMSQTQLQLACVDLSKSILSTGVIRDVLFVPASMPAVNLLLRMQSTPVHLALVVDEYGGTDGLVTIENLIEEIFGDIGDEHEGACGALIKEAPDGLIAEARTPIDELSERLGGIELVPAGREDEVDTLGGLIFTLLGRVPLRGEMVPHASGIEFEVLEADPRRIKKLKIHLNKPGTAASRVAKTVAGGGGQV